MLFRSRIADAFVVGVLVAYGQGTVWTADAAAVAQDRPVHALLVAVATVPLFVRRHRPLAALLLCLGAGWLHDQLGGESGVLWFGLCLGLYGLGAHADRRSLLAGTVAVAAAVLSFDVPRLLAGAAVDDVLPAWFILAGLVGLGRWIRSRGQETRELAVRAELAERTRAEHAARAVAEERARIARELHDLVAHAMGVIVIQAQAGQRTVATDPDAARSAFGSIETAGRQGLAEMRRLLHLLTTGQDGSVAPQPSLRELDDLVARVRSAGVPVDVHVAGDVSALPAGVDLAAYRIVQEALTNMLEHAGPATARLLARRRGSPRGGGVRRRRPGGAVSDTDDRTAAPVVACTPPSGAVFPIGTSVVDCTATDQAGLSSTGSFAVHVRNAADQLGDLLSAVTGVGPGTSLADKAGQAAAALESGDTPPASGPSWAGPGRSGDAGGPLPPRDGRRRRAVSGAGRGASAASRRRRAARPPAPSTAGRRGAAARSRRAPVQRPPAPRTPRR